ncbi:MAG: hypothetical protein R3175_04515 [Marinobacter sp.]|uniref:Flp family type IVb pilin n=1 Tax=Marinobacter sp. TaxID=50741 RepID=UPI00299DB8C3|nr:hypothetical protein [Marinobacter sp.]MDX1755304.1 hypothetical protein [Marinobacter sp.]
MKLNGITNLSRRLSVKVQTATLPGKQQGASALEYMVLAAAIIVIIGVLSTNTTVQTTLSNAFNQLFTDASGGGSSS